MSVDGPMQVLALNVGQPADVVYHGRPTTTAGDKRPVAAAWLAGIGCTVLALIAVCCIAAVVLVYLFLPSGRSAIAPLLAMM